MEHEPHRRPVTHYRDLVVWQRAMELAEESYLLAGRVPWHRGRNLRDQIERSGASVAANIAEGTAASAWAITSGFSPSQTAR